MKQILSWVPILFALSNIPLVLGATLQGLGEFGSVALGRLVGQVSLCAGLFVLAAQDNAIAGVMTSYLLGYSVEAIVLAVLLCRRLPSKRADDAKLKIRRFLRYGLGVNVLAGVDFVSTAAPRFAAVSAGVPAVVVGLDVASRVGSMMMSLTAPLLQPLVAQAARLGGSVDTPTFEASISRCALASSVIGSVTTAGTFLAWPVIAGLWLGSQSNVPTSVVGLVVAGYALSAMAGAPYAALLGLGEVATLVRSKWIGLVLLLAVLFVGVRWDLSALVFGSIALSNGSVLLAVIFASVRLPGSRWVRYTWLSATTVGLMAVLSAARIVQNAR